MSETLQGGEKARFSGLLLLGLAMAVAVCVVAFIIDSEIGIPVVILTVICLAAAVGYRVLAGSNRDDADSDDNVPKQGATTDRPLGDTPEAHDEVSPHDLPLTHPGRHEAERQAGSIDGTTRGSLRG